MKVGIFFWKVVPHVIFQTSSHLFVNLEESNHFKLIYLQTPTRFKKYNIILAKQP